MICNTTLMICHAMYLNTKSILQNQINAGTLERSHSEAAVKESGHRGLECPENNENHPDGRMFFPVFLRDSQRRCS